MRVLGIDPGTAVLGYGVVDSRPGAPGVLVECGVLRTVAAESLPVRLRALHAGLNELLARHAPDIVAIETAFYGRNVHTTMMLSHARAVALLAAAQHGVDVAEYAPATVKKTIVGRGGALKPQVGFMVRQLLHLAATPEPADAADGVALALTHLMLRGRQLSPAR